VQGTGLSPVLAIETSCDDTAAALVARDGRVLSSAVSSQNEVHAPYGGVVPELASRQHLRDLPRVVERALETAGASLGDVSGVSVTAGPGLLGSLLVGVSYAKALAWALQVPLAGINHVEAHLHSPWIENPGLPYPALALVVSGGHSHLFLSESPRKALLVCATRDDAAGEALDKLAKRLGLPYPGGPVLDRLASRGDPKAVAFSLPKMSAGSLDFSFSGIKTAALYHLRQRGLEPPADAGPEELPQWVYDLIASYQKRIVDHLLQRLKKAALLLKPASFTAAGGVACNSLLRSRLVGLGRELGAEVGLPSPRYCTDNAAMIGFHAATARDWVGAGAPDLDAFPTARWERALPS
jgi:N6-L-threonylcarbamoyladenine synthase